MKDEGVEFVTEADIGQNIKAKKIMDDYDAVVLAVRPPLIQEISMRLEGMLMEYILQLIFLQQQLRVFFIQIFTDGKYISAKDKNVIVIGGGDTR